MNKESQPFVLGLDIGGANIKVADSNGNAFACSFALWRQPDDLEARLKQILDDFPGFAACAVTMTGELADCFNDRDEGVSRIIRQCRAAVGERLLVYSVDGVFLSSDDAVYLPDDVAASNWHALATLASRWCDSSAVLIDIGSTTTDIICLDSGGPTSTSRTDFDRLGTGELLYLGISRTPICALVELLPFRGRLIPVMNEVFAAMDDCALLARILEESDEIETCDGRPRNRPAAANRIARMIGLDHRTVTIEEAESMAHYVIERWRARIDVAVRTISPPDAMWILSGHGSRLLEIPDGKRCVDLSITLGPQLSRVAPAFAVACLAWEKVFESTLISN